MESFYVSSSILICYVDKAGNCHLFVILTFGIFKMCVWHHFKAATSFCVLRGKTW